MLPDLLKTMSAGSWLTATLLLIKLGNWLPGYKFPKCVGCAAVEHGLGDGLGVIKAVLTLILSHFITCPEEAKFVPRISCIPYQTLTYCFWPYFLSLIFGLTLERPTRYKREKSI